MPYYIQCQVCKNYLGDGRCFAFEKKDIPFEIISGEFDHTKKHPDQDNDILFEPIEKGK